MSVKLPMYELHDWGKAMLAPWRAAAALTTQALTHPFNPLSYTPGARATVAACDVFERVTRTYDKPAFGIDRVEIDGREVAIREEVIAQTPFCRLLRFRREIQGGPRVLLVAPLSGHYATLLRETIRELSRYAEVYVTDWESASKVPVSAGPFRLDDYVELVRAALQRIGPGTHVMAVCQPAVPVLAAVALMNEDRDPATPPSMVLMGGPIDTRVNPTKPSELAMAKPLSWFRDTMVHRVPAGHLGHGREVCPGFMQQIGFVGMNLGRHVEAHQQYFHNLLTGAAAAVATHRRFYDEYNAVLDMPAEYYMQTIDAVFQRHLLPKGELEVNGRRVDLGKITRTAMMTVEGEKDDITGPGQTRAAHALLANLPAERKQHHEEPGTGHYGIFSGKRWRNTIAPSVATFLKRHTPAACDDA